MRTPTEMSSRIRQWLSLALPFCVLLIFIMETKLSTAADSISRGQFLSGNQTISSRGGNFELGFLKLGKSQNYYLCIWYKMVSQQTVVWMANRETPLPDSSSQLTISNGSLVLVNKLKRVIWSTTSSIETPNSTVAVLLDTGNLVVTDGLNSSAIIWQSFDHPTDTWLPGARLGLNKITGKRQSLTSWRNYDDPTPGFFSFEIDRAAGSSQISTILNGSGGVWTSGNWDGKTFAGVPQYRTNYIFNFSFVENKREKYFTYSLYDPSTIASFVMNVSGVIQPLKWFESSKEWRFPWNSSEELCHVYSLCGNYGSCNQKSLPKVCTCLQGFKPASTEDWNSSNWFGGCVRQTPLQCGYNTSSSGKKDRFRIMQNMQLEIITPRPSTVRGSTNCELNCLSDCSCTAYAYGHSGCWKWNGDLRNLRQDSGGDSNTGSLYIRLAASDQPVSRDDRDKMRRVLIIVTLPITAGIVLVSTSLYCVWWRVKNRGNRENVLMMPFSHLRAIPTNVQEFFHGKTFRNEGKVGVDLPFFNLATIAAATENFSDSNKLGKGGFGPVYKGKLQEGQLIAVKKLSKSSAQGLQEFTNEVELIAKLQHRNLVRILGHCIERNEKMLVYEYMPNKSLDYFLFDENRGRFLDWEKRFLIILGIARGLLYIHQDSRLRIIHRDIKTSNILLDEEMNAKISDFGLAKIFGGDENQAKTNRVVGTYGYMSPEYVSRGIFSVKSDVFSFGVILLETISGKKNTGFNQSTESFTLLEHAWRLWEEEKGMDLMDSALNETCNKGEVLKCIQVGLLCVQEDPTDRPTMASVFAMLVSKTTTLSVPKKPAFVPTSLSHMGSSSSGQVACTINEVTISTEYGR